MKPARTPCSVVFCRRTTAGQWAFWMCADHWRMVDRSLKQLRTKLRRRFQRRGEVTVTDRAISWLSPRAWRVCCGIHRRMIRQATERASGISL